MNNLSKIQLMLEEEFKIMADENENIKVVRYGNHFNFSADIREYIIFHSEDLFMNIDEKELRNKMYYFIDLVTKYHNQGIVDIIKVISQKTTSKKRNKEKNMFKGIEYIFDYLDGDVNLTNKSRKLKELLKELKSNPKSFKGQFPKKYTKQNFKTDLRKLFPNNTDEINNFVDEFNAEHITINNSQV